ncbi:MAG: hypothetical protein WC712_01175 [Candidatus Brocadiia bacterium]
MKHAISVLFALCLLSAPMPASARWGSEIDIRMTGCYGRIGTFSGGWSELRCSDLEVGDLLLFSGGPMTFAHRPGGPSWGNAAAQTDAVLAFLYDGGPTLSIEVRSDPRGLVYLVNGVPSGLLLQKEASDESPFGSAEANKGISCVTGSPDMTPSFLAAINCFPDARFFNIGGSTTAEEIRTAMKGRTPKWLACNTPDTNIALDFPTLLYGAIWLTAGGDITARLRPLEWKYVRIVASEGGCLDDIFGCLPECVSLAVSGAYERATVAASHFRKLGKLKGLSLALGQGDLRDGFLDLSEVLTPHLGHLCVSGQPRNGGPTCELRISEASASAVALKTAFFRWIRLSDDVWKALSGIRSLYVGDDVLTPGGTLPALGLALDVLDLTGAFESMASLFTSGFVSSAKLLRCRENTVRELPKAEFPCLAILVWGTTVSVDMTKLNVHAKRIWLCFPEVPPQDLSVVCPEGTELQILMRPSGREMTTFSITRGGEAYPAFVLICDYQDIFACGPVYLPIPADFRR